MSRNIGISFKDAAGKETDIKIQAPYYLLGTERLSVALWSIPRLKEIGIERLTILGEMDPRLHTETRNRMRIILASV